MSAVSHGWSMKCDKCGYTTEGTWNDPQAARQVLQSRGWACVQVPTVIGPDITDDYCRVCVTIGRVQVPERK